MTNRRTRFLAALRGGLCAALLLGVAGLWVAPVQGRALTVAPSTPAFPKYPDGKFSTSQEDLRVKIRGGHILWTREYDGNRWRFNARWTNLRFEFDRVAMIGVVRASGSGPGGPGGGRAIAVATPEPEETFGGTVVPGFAFDDSPQSENPAEAFTSDSGPLQWIYRNGAVFTADDSQMAFTALGTDRYIIRPILAPGFNGTRQVSYPGGNTATIKGIFKTDIAEGKVLGWRWTDRNGDWIEYNSGGGITRYGDRNNLIITFEYETVSGVRRIHYVRDPAGVAVLEWIYSPTNPSLLVEVRDPTGTAEEPVRRVQYEYNGGSIRRVIDVRGFSSTFEYDGKSRISALIDQEGRAFRITYSDTNRMIQNVAPDGGVTNFAYEYDKTRREFFVRIAHPQTAAGRQVETRWYDKEGRLLRISIDGEDVFTLARHSDHSTTYTDRRGNTFGVSWNSALLPTSVQYPDGSQISVSYNTKDLSVASITERGGATNQYTYDERGNVVSAVYGASGSGARADYVLDDYAQPTSRIWRGGGGSVSAPDQEEKFEYDERGNVVVFTNGEGNVTRLAYDRAGNPVRLTDPLGRVWRLTNDAAGRPTEMRTPLDYTYGASYNKAGDLVTLLDPRNQSWTYGYDSGGRLSQRTTPLSHSGTRTFNAFDQVTRETDAEGRAFTYEYDTSGRPVKFRDGQNNLVSMSYAEDSTPLTGNLPLRIDYPTYFQKYQFDGMDRPTAITSVLGSEQRVAQFAYGQRGDPTSITNEYGKTHQVQYDGHGRITRFTDSLDKSVSMAYDAHGNLRAVTDQRGNATRFEYDRANRLTREVRPLGQATVNTYDANGNLTQSTDANGARVVNSYDNDSRLVRREYFAPNGSTPENVATFAYDNDDNLTGWANNGASAVITYDAEGNKLSETVDYGGGVTLRYAYTYTAAGYKRTLTYPDDTVVSYAYDANGMLSSVDIPGEGSLSVNERNWLAPTRITLPGGTVQTLTVDPLLSMTSLNVKNPSQQNVFSLSNKFGKVQDLTERTVNGNTSTFTHDDEQRLTSFTGSGAAAFTLDPAGNRLTQSGIPGTWEYDANNRLTRAGDTTYTWDDAGNLVREQNGALVRTFKYDADNRLAEIGDGQGTVLANYVYDPFGRRLWKEVNGVRTYFLYADEGLIAEANSTGAVTTQYGWQPDRTWGTQPLFVKTLIGSGAGAQVAYAYIHCDHLGTPMGATNREGEVVWRATTNPFGATTILPGNQMVLNLRLPGQYFDAESGLHYNWHRYYDPRIGRYTQADPARLLGGPNFYLYVGGNPLNLIDPYGLWWFGDPLPQGLVDFSAGFGDTLSFGLTNKIRDWMGINDVVDQCSGWYTAGEVSGVAVGLAFGGGTAGKNIAANGLKNAVKETRSFGTIGRNYSSKFGSRGGGRGPDLDHFFFAQQGGRRGNWVNSAWNIVPLSPRVNQVLLNPDAWRRGTQFIPQTMRKMAQGGALGLHGAAPTAAIRNIDCGCQ